MGATASMNESNTINLSSPDKRKLMSAVSQLKLEQESKDEDPALLIKRVQSAYESLTTVQANKFELGSMVDYTIDPTTGLFSGQGALRLSNGDYYKGHMKNGKRDGQGECYYKSGCHYIGEWKDDLRSGIGSFTYASGSVRRGPWLNDKYIGKHFQYSGIGMINHERVRVEVNRAPPFLSKYGPSSTSSSSIDKVDDINRIKNEIKTCDSNNEEDPGNLLVGIKEAIKEATTPGVMTTAIDGPATATQSVTLPGNPSSGNGVVERPHPSSGRPDLYNRVTFSIFDLASCVALPVGYHGWLTVQPEVSEAVGDVGVPTDNPALPPTGTNGEMKDTGTTGTNRGTGTGTSTTLDKQEGTKTSEENNNIALPSEAVLSTVVTSPAEEVAQGTLLPASGSSDPDSLTTMPQAHGFGIIKYTNGDIYMGMFAYGVREGSGQYRYASGDEYIKFLSARTYSNNAREKFHKETLGESGRHKGSNAKKGDKYAPPRSSQDIFEAVDKVKHLSR